MHFLLTALLLCIAPMGAVALDGKFVQGGFAVGQVAPGTEVTMDGEDIPVGEDGTYVVGFHRHAGPEVTLSYTAPNGENSQKTVLIEPREYETQHIKGVKKKHVNPNPEHLKRIRSDSAQINKARSVFEPLGYIRSPFVWPVSDTISGVYGSRRTFNGEERSWHKGVDVAAPTGTPIVAPAPAVVRLALPDSFFNGNLLILDHGHQLFTIYAHLQDMAVKTGDIVHNGQKIGTVGATGRVTGPHLHWGLYWRNIALDPMLLVK